jgi:hypothetical protein
MELCWYTSLRLRQCGCPGANPTADILALPNLSQRPLVPARFQCIPDLSEGI